MFDYQTTKRNKIQLGRVVPIDLNGDDHRIRARYFLLKSGENQYVAHITLVR
jgi:hypothetical protein